MDQVHSTTEHRKGKHLSFEERVVIQTRLKDGWTPNRIAGELGCAPNTVRNEIKRGTATLYRGNIFRYKAKVGQAAYEKNREACCRHYDLLEKSAFISYVEEHFFEDEWSLDVCAHRNLKDGTFTRKQIVCTKTLYGYADLGLLNIRNIDLPEKLHRSPKTARVRENKRVLGRSIEERPASIEDRTEFGHWEVDLVIGSKSGNDDALLTMIERKTREYWMILIPGRDPNGVMEALREVRSQYDEHWDDVFKTITTDNGSEFSLLSGLEDLSNTLVYFAHPYTSCEKGSVERNNGLIRRFIPKGCKIDSLRLDVAYCLNPNFMRKLRAFCDSVKPDFFLLGEILFGDYKRIVNPEMLHSCTNYECYKGLYSSFNDLNLFEINYALNRQFGKESHAIYQGEHLLSFADNHDVTRVASILKEKRHLPLIYCLLFGMPGIPCIYYGSEWGILGEKGQGSDDALRPELAAPEWNELTDAIASFAELRKSHKALTYGDYKSIVLTNRQLVFEREFEGERIWFGLNAEDKAYHAHFNGADAGTATDLLRGEQISLSDGYQMPPFGYFIWKLN